MRAIVVHEPGSPEVVALGEVGRRGFEATGLADTQLQALCSPTNCS